MFGGKSIWQQCGYLENQPAKRCRILTRGGKKKHYVRSEGIKGKGKPFFGSVNFTNFTTELIIKYSLTHKWQVHRLIVEYIWNS